MNRPNQTNINNVTLARPVEQNEETTSGRCAESKFRFLVVFRHSFYSAFRGGARFCFAIISAHLCSFEIHHTMLASYVHWLCSCVPISRVLICLLLCPRACYVIMHALGKAPLSWNTFNKADFVFSSPLLLWRVFRWLSSLVCSILLCRHRACCVLMHVPSNAPLSFVIFVFSSGILVRFPLLWCCFTSSMCHISCFSCLVCIGSIQVL
jgi:hypothetical protein